MATDPERSHDNPQTEATADFTPDVAPTEFDPNAPRNPPEPRSDGGATSAYEPSEVPGSEETQLLDSVNPPIGAPATDETGAYDPGATRDMTGSVAATRAHETGRHLAEEDAEFTLGAGGAPTRYILKKFHARGGMGEIWLADDIDIGRSVALKRMRTGKEGNKEKFFMEARVTGRLEHPGIVPVHELGVDEKGRPFYIMKFVHGPTLKDAINAYHKPSPDATTPREVQRHRLLENFVSLCQTVAYAHSRGIIHRDIKPDNVMLGTYGETLVLDWGIAKLLGQAEGPEYSLSGGGFSNVSGESHETEMGTVKGTPSYFSPEMADGRVDEIDQRSDVYLLGGTLYQILTGQRPRKGSDLSQLIRLARTQLPTPPRKLDSGIARALEAICQKAMAAKKEDRYESALALAEDVQRYLAGEKVAAYREPLVERAWRWARKHRRGLGRAAAVVLLLGAASFAFVEIRAAQRTADAARAQAAQLQEQDEARRQVDAFRDRADEARFYLASLSPVAENAPYYELDKGTKAAQAALAIADRWGPTLDALPLADLTPQLRTELYDLLLLLVDAERLQAPEARAAPGMLALLDRAAGLADPSRGFYRLRSACLRLAGKASEADDDQQRADDPKVALSALDHFLLGEQYRTDAASLNQSPPKPKGWEPNRDLFVKAMEQYQLAIQKNPQHYWSHFQVARLNMGLGRWGEALEDCSACVALRPASSWGYNIRAGVLVQLKRFAEAERDLNKVLTDHPEILAARLARGILYWRQKKEKEALADFEAVLQAPAGKRLLEAAFYRGQLYLQRGEEGDLQKSLADFDKVVTEKPDFYRVYPFRAMVHLILNKDSQALEDLNIYIARGKVIDAKDPDVIAQRGRLLRLIISDLKRFLPSETRLQKWLLAAQDCKKAIDLGGKSVQLYDDFGAALENLLQIKMAIAAYTAGLKLDGGNAKLLGKRGWALAADKQFDKARADFSAIIKDHPDHAEAHAGLGYVGACVNKAAEANREANLALLHGADDYLVLHNVACIYAELSDADAGQEKEYQDLAMDELRRAVELWKREPSSLDEIDLIEQEGSFRRGMKSRPDFLKLIRRDN